jgi:ribulose-bisphosphate carboxylase small chain
MRASADISRESPDRGAREEAFVRVNPQGPSSVPPDPDDDQIRGQLAYAIERCWAIAVEHADDPHPSNACWETWGAPVLDVRDAARALDEVKACRAAHPDRYVHVVAFDALRGTATVRLSLLAHRPATDPALELRRDFDGRRVRYTLRARQRDRGVAT